MAVLVSCFSKTKFVIQVLNNWNGQKNHDHQQGLDGGLDFEESCDEIEWNQ